MARKPKQVPVEVVGSASDRYDELKKMLAERRDEIMKEVEGKIRDARQNGDKRKASEAAEMSEIDIQEDIEFALVQMKFETLAKIEEALLRLENGDYGRCFECRKSIAAPRLRALPFAVRCKDCEEAREFAQQRERVAARRGSATHGFDMRP